MNLEDKFETNLNELKYNNSFSSLSKCESLLKEMYFKPESGLGEISPILTEKVDRFCKISGKSYETVMTEMSMPKLNNFL